MPDNLMNIVEQHVVGKHSLEDCEDGIVATDDYVAVIDGSTSKTPHHFNATMKNGRYCMLAVCQFVRTAPPNATLQQFCRLLTAAVRALYPPHVQAEALPPHERLCASAVVYSRHCHEVWMIGDCQCMVDSQTYPNEKPYEEALARQRAAAFDDALKLHPDMVCRGRLLHDYARDTIVASLIASMAGQNRTYAVVDGTPIFMPGVKTISISRTCRQIVLASDGYPVLCPTLTASEDALHDLLDKDSYCVRTFKATKGLMAGNASFDDRAYIRFTP